jgi:major vault protein
MYINFSGGKPQRGHRKIVRGEKFFFLQPGERLSDEGIRSMHILAPESALWVRAKETFTEEQDRRGVIRKKDRKPGGKIRLY